jgi:hypothetical protein
MKFASQLEDEMVIRFSKEALWLKISYLMPFKND